MPLTTRCRHCGRLFPIYAQQLKEKRGKTSCPQCGRRFNALAGLLDEVVPGSSVVARGRPSGRRRKPAASAPAPAPAPALNLDRTPRPRRQATGLWLTGVLMLVVALVAQAAWWERAHWLAQPKLRGIAEDVCARLGCRISSPRVAGAIEILQPYLGEHPQNPRILRLAMTLINHASIAQDLPTLQLELYDQTGSLAAVRRFAPDQYLAEPHADGLDAGAAVNLGLDLAMPEAAPSGFRLRLL